MVLHGALAETEVGGDILAGMTERERVAARELR
jgi:hypothetical protein